MSTMENCEAKRSLILLRILNILAEVFQALSDGVHHIWRAATENHQKALESCCRKDMEKVTELLSSNSNNLLTEKKRFKV